MAKKAYLIDVGILLDSSDKEVDAYNTVYDKKHGYYDENQYYKAYLQQAIREANAYVNAGVDQTYAVVSKTMVPDYSKLEDTPVEGESYNLENVVYSVAKLNGKVVPNFIQK